MSRETSEGQPEQSNKPDNYRNRVESPALTTTHLYEAASTLLRTNPNMSPEDRAKYFTQMAEDVARKLMEDKIY